MFKLKGLVVCEWQAASLYAYDRETEIEDACETIALCLKLSCGRQAEQPEQPEEIL